MKHLKLAIIIFSTLILSACTPSTQNITGENLDYNDTNINPQTERLSNISESNSNNTTRFPVGGKYISGDESLNIMNNPKTTELDIEFPNKELVGSYSSKVYTKTEDRQKNLRIVCEKLTGTILKPNEEFSYNATCGPYNKENGFGKATVFLGDGTEKQDYGGGVCQLSSTLYNAIRHLDIEITERHNHSKKVYYVPDGQDATVSYGNLDFKFKNIGSYTLLIEASSSSEAVNVNIYKI